MGPPPLPPEYYGIELERLTDKQVSKNITFPQTMYAGGNKETEIQIFSCLWKIAIRRRFFFWKPEIKVRRVM